MITELVWRRICNEFSEYKERGEYLQTIRGVQGRSQVKTLVESIEESRIKLRLEKGNIISLTKEHIDYALNKLDDLGVIRQSDVKEPKRYVLVALKHVGDCFEVENRNTSKKENVPHIKWRVGAKEKLLNSNEIFFDNITLREQKDRPSNYIPALEPSERSREYNIYKDEDKDSIVYEYLFNSKSHRWLDEFILRIAAYKRTGHESMNILHYIGIKDNHKGIFKDYSIVQAINKLEQQDSDFSLVIQSLQRHEQQVNVELDKVMESAAEEYFELETIVSATPEQIELTETEKEQIIRTRIGQSTFKKALLNIEKKCRLCGVSDERFLVASHIKPWSQADNQERLDVNNGLLLCPNHDALFDKGYISFDDNGSILISDSLDETTKVFLNINESLKIRMNEGQKAYMKWHRKNIFKLI